MNWYTRYIAAAVTPEDKQQEIINFYTQTDIPATEIAEAFGVGKDTVFQILKRHKIPFRGHNKAKLPTELSNKIVEEYQAGVSRISLSRKYNVSYRAIENELRSRGIPVRNRDESMRTDLHRQERSEISKQVWDDPALRKRMDERWRDPEYQQRQSEQMLRVWEERGDFWSWLATFPLEKRLNIIDGMIGSKVQLGQMSKEREWEMRNTLHIRARQLDEMPAAHKPYATGDELDK